MAIEIKAPAFQFYADHWLADENVRLLTLEETGAYIDAMAYCWREGSIPADPARLARLIGKGCSIEVATSVQRLFNVRSTPVQPGNERIEHKRLNEEREKQKQRRTQQSKAGEKSAESRRKGNQDKTKQQVQRPFNGRSTDVQHPCNSTSTFTSTVDLEKTTGAGDQSAKVPEHEEPRVVPFAFCVNVGVTDIDLGGKCLEYHEDPAVWESEFIRRWNRLPRVNQRTQGALDHPLQKALQQRLLDPTWRWQQAFAMFPIEMDLDFVPNLTWFLKPDTVSRILDKSFRKTKRTGGKKSAVDFAANLRAFAEGGSDEQFVFESSRIYDDGGTDDGGMPEGNASLAD